MNLDVVAADMLRLGVTCAAQLCTSENVLVNNINGINILFDVSLSQPDENLSCTIYPQQSLCLGRLNPYACRYGCRSVDRCFCLRAVPDVFHLQPE